MFGFGWSEVLIIGAVLIVMIGLVVGVVAFAVSLARRRESRSARSAALVDKDGEPRDGRG